jgi:gliding motility-associated-like protein
VNSVQWYWDFGNGNTSQLANPGNQTYRTVGTTTVLAAITTTTGCMDTIRSSVTVHPKPIVYAGPDTFSCRMTGIRLQASGADTYSWSPSSGLSCSQCPNPMANPTYDVDYRVTGRTTFGCEGKDTVHITVINPFVLTVSPPDSVCKGNSKRLSASGGYRYSWTPSAGLDNPNIPNPTATPDISTNYRVEAVDEKGCFHINRVVPIAVYSIPKVELDDETTVVLGNTIDLVPRISPDVYDARWSPTAGLFRTEFPGITVKPSQTTTYTVEVFNRHGCTNTDQITVNVMCNNSNMFVPNSFSPNGDGMNDVFFPRGTGIFTIKSMRIFSRWGEVIYQRNNFKANDPSKGWDGSFKGQKMNADAFVYTIEVICDNQAEMTFKGSVTLIR